MTNLDPIKSRVHQLSNRLGQLYTVIVQLIKLPETFSKIQEALGRIEMRQLQEKDNKRLISNEFRVFSQWGEDGIIQYLINNVNIQRKIFVEFGVENYLESNTRFLLINNNWSGLVIDGNRKKINYIKKDKIYWQFNLKAQQAFITKENINKLIAENGITGEIGLLSIDIDGNDYWVWQAIDTISPAIVVIEYNCRFGNEKAVSIPYDPGFVRSKAHYSMLFYGASLKALYLLAQQKGYAFVGCNSAGNDAFFVRRDLMSESIQELTVEQGYVAAHFRESRNQEGKCIYLSPDEEQKILAALPLLEVTVKINDKNPPETDLEQ